MTTFCFGVFLNQLLVFSMMMMFCTLCFWLPLSFFGFIKFRPRKNSHTKSVLTNFFLWKYRGRRVCGLIVHLSTCSAWGHTPATRRKRSRRPRSRQSSWRARHGPPIESVPALLTSFGKYKNPQTYWLLLSLTGKMGAVKGKSTRERQELSIVRGQARTGEDMAISEWKGYSRTVWPVLTSLFKVFQPSRPKYSAVWQTFSCCILT
jgi:hypothetical protein